MKLMIKAIGDTWELDVLGIPYGSAIDKDSDGEYFSKITNLHEDKFPNPPVVYFHGRDEYGKALKTPQYIGETISHEDRSDGRWYRVALDRTNQYAQRIWEAAKAGIAFASTGSVKQLVRFGRDGGILEWPVVELTLVDQALGKSSKNRHAVAIPVLKAVYKQAGLNLPDMPHDDENNTEINPEDTTVSAVDSAETQTHDKIKHKENNLMGNEENPTNPGLDEKQVADIVAKALQRDRDVQKAEREAIEAREAETQKAVEEALKAQREEIEEEAKKARRLPFNASNAPVVGKFGDIRKFSHLDAKDQVVMMGVMLKAGHRPSESAYKALVVKMGEDKSPSGEYGRETLKAHGIDAVKANEVNYSTLASYGDEWVFDAQTQMIMENVRDISDIAQRIPSIVVPQGSESITIPLESTDPTFGLVSQVASDAATGGLSEPVPTVPSSRMGTANNQLTVGKVGARVRWSTELDEDSIVPFAAQLRKQIVNAAATTMNHMVIDGDTETSASTNINDIAGTPGGTESFLLFNGFRKSCLVTTTANSFSGGTLGSDDFVSTLKMLGAAGINAADPRAVSFIIDPNVHWKMLTEVTELKTRDTWGASSPMIESGAINQIWGVDVLRSYQMHWAGRALGAYAYKANADGKVDLDTAGNNTTGSILAVRWDQWVLGWKRQLKMTVTPKPEYDGHELVAIMRLGLLQRDTEGAAITYNLTV